MRIHPLCLAEQLDDLSPDDAPKARPAVAGGSDHRPSDDGERSPAEVIRFPIERVRGGRYGHAQGESHSPAPHGEPLWPTWMARVLDRDARTLDVSA